MNLLKNEVKLADIKLIIWDLDDTFWQGTISEGNVSYIKENIDFVKTLVDKGIMNSICSKNDYSVIQKEFEKQELKEIKDLFIFSSINWENKGLRIKNIIENAQLREQNILFIDDNIMNLKEAVHYNPKIKTIFPNQIKDLIIQLDEIKKQDYTHTRLKQYKTLELKQKDRKEYKSNDEFLFKSNIKVEIKTDCENEIERIKELILRTNQLNFTKNRILTHSNGGGLEELLNNSDFENAYIKVKDNYGDYGIVGFYSLNKKTNSLVHFLFSCRILGMGVEQYIYSKLNYPKIQIVGETASKLEKNKTVNWINSSEIKQETKNNKTLKTQNFKILLKGPCDLRSILNYVDIKEENFVLDFAFRDKQGVLVQNMSSFNVAESLKISKDEIEKLTKEYPFISCENFNQIMFKEKFDIIVYSLLLDYREVLYKNKHANNFLTTGNPFDILNKKNWSKVIEQKTLGHNFTYKQAQNMLEKFSENYEYFGHLDASLIIENLKLIIKNVSEDTKWIFILGSEIEPDERLIALNEKTYKIYQRHVEINKELIEFLKNQENVQYINLTDIVKDKSNYTDFIDHFTRQTYFNLAQNLSEKINLLSNKTKLIKTSKYKLVFNNISKTISNFTRKIFYIGNDYTRGAYKLGKYILIFGYKIKLYKNQH